MGRPGRHGGTGQHPLPGFEEKGDGSDDEGDSGAVSILSTGVDLPKREATAEEKVLTALRREADPLHLDYLNGADDIDPTDFDIAYMERPALLAATGLSESTFANALTKLETAGKIHRLKEGKLVRVGLGRQVDGNDAAA